MRGAFWSVLQDFQEVLPWVSQAFIASRAEDMFLVSSGTACVQHGLAAYLATYSSSRDDTLPGAFHRSFYTCPNVYFLRTFRFTIEVLPEDVSWIGVVVVDTDDVKLCRATIAEVDRLGLEVLRFWGVEVLG